MAGIFKAYDIRGIYPSQLDESMAESIGRALVSFLKAKKVVIGRDMRPHSKPLFEAMARGITEQGADVIDVGMCSTPMSYYANGKLGADGSVIITASHNPAEWNGMKLCRQQAIPISGATGIMDIERIVTQKSWGAPLAPKGKITAYDIAPEYGRHICSFARLNRKLKVVADFANAMGSFEIAGIRDLFDVIPLYEKLDGTFPSHEANPLKTETLDALCAKVKETGADFGAGFDGDADRCGFVDDKGEIIPMDIFTALLARDILSNGPATILYDLRSSWAVKECIEENGGKAIMSRVGHAFIKAQMREYDAVFAGELSGHYYFKENYTTESQGLAMITLANLLCKTGKKVSELVAPLQKYAKSPERNFMVDDAKAVLAKIKTKYADGKAFELDGLSVEYKDWWFNVRTSNTEPLVRLNLEARTQAQLDQKLPELSKLIGGTPH